MNMGLKRKNKLNKIVPLEVYPFDIMFSFNETDDELRSTFNKYNIIESNYFESTLKRGKCSVLDTGQIVIRLKNYPDSPEEYGYLAHEIYHAVNFLMEKIGVKFSEDSEECFAYLIAFITTKIHKEI